MPVSDKPRILQSSRSINDSGGISKVALFLAREWTKSGYAVETLTSKIGKGCEEGMGKWGLVTDSPAESRGVRRYLRSFLWTLRFTLKVHQEYRSRNASVVTISHRDSFGADICVGHSCHRAVLISKRREGRNFWFLNPIHLLYLYQEHRIFRRWPYRYLVAVSAEIAREYRRYYKVPENMIRIIPNGVDVDAFNPNNRESARKSVLAALNLPDAMRVLLFAGHEFSRKGLEPVIRSLPGIRDVHNNPIHLLVLGQDDTAPYRQMAKSCGVADKISFLGHRTDAPMFFNAADLFLMPSSYEAFGLVGIEAMAAGVPVLATCVGGIQDYLRNGENGLTIHRDSEDIAEKATALLSDRTQWERLSKTARETALGYQWHSIARRYAELVEKVAADKKLRFR